MTNNKNKSSAAELGFWLTIPSTIVAEIYSLFPYDFGVIDLEHSTISLDDMQNMLSVLEAANKRSLIRLSENNSTLIKRVMDAGASGVIVPMVNTVEDAKRIIDSVYYPPKGKRGVGLARAQKYGEGFPEYKIKSEKDHFEIIVQIEHIDAVNNLSDILDLEQVDGFIVGPYDLSASLGLPGNFEDKSFLEALVQIEKIAENTNKKQGFHLVEPSVQEYKKLLDKSYNFIVYSLDVRQLATSAKSIFEIEK